MNSVIKEVCDKVRNRAEDEVCLEVPLKILWTIDMHIFFPFKREIMINIWQDIHNEFVSDVWKEHRIA